jgi:hypothetical protein
VGGGGVQGSKDSFFRCLVWAKLDNNIVQCTKYKYKLYLVRFVGNMTHRKLDKSKNS